MWLMKRRTTHEMFEEPSGREPGHLLYMRTTCREAGPPNHRDDTVDSDQ